MATEPTEPVSVPTALKLDAPDPVIKVEAEKAAGLVPIEDEKKSQLADNVDKFIAELSETDANSPEFGRRVDQLTALGRAEIEEAANYSNRFLDRPTRSLNSESDIGKDLTELRRTVEDLDPGKRGNLMTKKKLFGIIPFGNKAREYFAGYQSAQGHISAILKRLASGKDELLRDNAAIDVERANLWKTMGKLEQMIFVAKTLDEKLERKAAELDASEPAKAKALRESALFYTRQRVTDLLTQMAVTVQGYLALDLVKKNNIELMKGVDRASTTTVSALRTGVTVAQAMTNQKLVLDQITALNTTTAGVIDSTGEMLRTQTGEIHKQAASSTIPIETLKRAFENVYATMDEIDSFKAESLGSMKQTVNLLTEEVEKSRGYIARAEGVEQAKLDTSKPAFTAIEG
ncbi:MAG: toxic anion resistance protein [Pseudomonadota bacterium]